MPFFACFLVVFQLIGNRRHFPGNRSGYRYHRFPDFRRRAAGGVLLDGGNHNFRLHLDDPLDAADSDFPFRWRSLLRWMQYTFGSFQDLRHDAIEDSNRRSLGTGEQQKFDALQPLRVFEPFGRFPRLRFPDGYQILIDHP